MKQLLFSAANNVGGEEILKKAEAPYIDGSIDIHTDAVALMHVNMPLFAMRQSI